MGGGTKGKVCVTGGTGFIASWLIKRLLEDGYSVTTTVRPDPEKKRDYNSLTNLPGASENLQIYGADLNDPHSFAPAFDGCIGVFHLATLFDPEERDFDGVIRTCKDGTLGILKACLDSNTVRRVVYTSSTCAVQCNYSKEEFMDEGYWSDIDYLKDNSPFGRSYSVSKTLTERAVLEFSEQHGLDVVTVLPTFVVGPFICPKLPESVRLAMALIFGIEAAYPMLSKLNLVHVDDLARAHIFLFEQPTARGRFICSSSRITLQELAEYLSAKYPEFQIPSQESLKDVKPTVFTYLSSKKLLDSGFEYKYGIDEMFDGAIGCCKEKGFL